MKAGHPVFVYRLFLLSWKSCRQGGLKGIACPFKPPFFMHAAKRLWLAETYGTEKGLFMGFSILSLPSDERKEII